MGNLNKVQYTDHQTVITANNLNDIQDAVIQNTSYVTCSTEANTAAKTATLANFVLTTGSAVRVKFTNTNTASNPTLNINSTGAKPIVKYGTTAAGTTPYTSWEAGAVMGFVYDGTSWVMQTRTDVDAMPKSGGTFTGNVAVVKANTTTESTQTLLTLGNNIASGTAGASFGSIQMFCDDEHYVYIRPYNTTYSANPTIMFPTKSGTIALDDAATTSAAGLMSAADKTKLNGIATGANAYTLPTASSSTLGGIKVGTNLSISNGVLSATDTTYGAATTSAAGLMSAADKTKLNGIATGANAYSLPTASSSTLGGIKVGTNLSISNGVLSAKDTTYSAATTSAAGLMSAGDKTKMNNLTISGPDGGYSWGSIGSVNKYAHIYRCVGLGLVFGTVAMYKTDSSTFNTDAVILTLSSGWRPSAQVGVDMMIKSGGTWYPYYGIISTGGALTQKLSGTCQGVYGSFFFKT